jgi:pimeloyl-ACP methyl ester carboxylesterase
MRSGAHGLHGCRRDEVEFDHMGHAPQMQDPVVFHAAFLKGLAALPATRQ